jgi:4-hydroxy-tetrahydrodipicolinate reductase
MKIGIVGSSGRMGKVLSALLADDECSGGVSGATSLRELTEIVEKSDVLIDFSTPTAALTAIEAAARCGVPVVTGTTDFSDADFEQMKEYAAVIPLLHASNFSIGIQLAAVFVRKCGEILSDFDFCITDKHHRQKKDAPSGTALFLARQTTKEAQIVSLREGNIFGEHICEFAGEHEMLSFCHRAFDREVFASGALKCARWIIGKSPGLYAMRNYLDDVFSVRS